MPRQMKDSGIPWVGVIPAEWKIGKGKYMLTLLSRQVRDDDGVITCFRDGEVTLRSNRRTEGYTFSDKEIGYQGIEPGDLVVHGMDGFAGAIGISDSRGKATPVLNVLDSDQNKTYLMYYLRLMAITGVFLALSTGIRVRSCDTNWNKIKELLFPMPPLKEQNRIAEFLKQQCKIIDSVLEKTKNSVEEYKKLKQAVITQAVTKGVRGNREMRDSDVEWLGNIPADWNVYRIANLYDERSESGLEELPILTVSINTGVSDHEIADEDKDRVFVRSEDRTKYKRVYPGDLAYNMMRAWQGAFGAVRVDGMVSPAYVVAKPKKNVKLDSRYMEALLRTSEATEEMHRYSRGIVDFRLRLYWPEFKNIRICLPPIAEQIEIADYIDEKSAAIDALIAKKEAFAAELENYKKSMIYEYVTGKKEVPQS